jgi:hypothetical protein
MSEGHSDRLSYVKELTLIAASLVGALLIVRIVFSNEISQGLSANQGLAGFDFVTPGVVSIVVVSIVFYMLRRRGEQVVRLLIAGMMAAGTLSGLLLLKIWFDESIRIPVFFYVCAAPLGYLGVYLSVRSFFGSLSERKTSSFLSVSTTFLGALVGILFPPLFTIFLLFALSLVDILMVDRDILRKIVGPERYDKVISVATVQLEKNMIGVGDLLAYSMLTVASLRSGNLYVASATIILILLGARITSNAAKSRLRMPGLPIPVFLGATPYLVGLLAL